MTRLRFGVLVTVVLLGLSGSGEAGEGPELQEQQQRQLGALLERAAARNARAVSFTAVSEDGEQDLNTLLVYFIDDLRAGTFSIGTAKDIKISSDGDGAVTFLGAGDGADEDLTINLDDTANRAVLSSTTGVTAVDVAALGVQVGGSSTLLEDGADNSLALRNGTNAQTFNLYNTFTDATNYERVSFAWATNNFDITTEKAGAGTIRNIRIFPGVGSVLWLGSNNATSWELNSTNWLASADGVGNFGASGLGRPGQIFLAAPSITAGAAVTVNDSGSARRLTYKATLTATSCGAPFQAAALTADCTIATLPAKTKLIGVYADVTAGFTCSGTCTGTKTIGAGKTAGGVEIFAAGLNVAATGQLGLSDADLGTGMTRAAAIQGGYLNSWSATTPVIVRFTSGTGNWGDGAVTYVNAGSVTFYLDTVVYP